MPEMLTKKPESKVSKTQMITERDPKEVMLVNLKGHEQLAMAKLERIKDWPKEQREAAMTRTEENLSQIRERIAKLESSK